MTPFIHRAFELSQTQARPAGQVAEAAAACLAAVLDATAEFAKSAASGNAAFATAMTPAKSLEAVIVIQHVLATDTVRAAAAMALKFADAGAAAARAGAAAAVRAAEPAAAGAPASA